MLTQNLIWEKAVPLLSAVLDHFQEFQTDQEGKIVNFWGIYV